MIDTENVPGAEEVGQVADNVEPVDQSGEETTQTNEAPVAEDNKDRNLYEARKAKERAEKERDEARRIIQEMESKQKPKPEPKEEKEEDEWNFGDDEDLAEVKHLKAMAKAIKKQKKELEEYKKQTTAVTAETRLKAQYPDLEKVVSSENIEKLKEVDPDLALSLQYNPDVYSKYSAAYKAIKRLNIYKEDKYVADKQKAQQNSNKPRPLTSVSPQQGDGPLSKANAFANGLTDELKKNLWKEMQEASERA